MLSVKSLYEKFEYDATMNGMERDKLLIVCIETEFRCSKKNEYRKSLAKAINNTSRISVPIKCDSLPFDSYFFIFFIIVPPAIFFSRFLC